MTPVCFIPVVSPDSLVRYLGQRRIVVMEQEAYRKIKDNSDSSFGDLHSAGATPPVWPRTGQSSAWFKFRHHGRCSSCCLSSCFEPLLHGAAPLGMAVGWPQTEAAVQVHRFEHSGATTAVRAVTRHLADG